MVYPVGCLYWSSKPTNPSELFGGKWTQIKDKFVLSAGDTYKVDKKGGNSSVQLSSENLPWHRHTIAHTHDRGNMEIDGWFEVGGHDGGWVLAGDTYGAFYISNYVSGRAGCGGEASSGKYPAGYEFNFNASRTWRGRTSQPFDCDGYSGGVGNNQSFSIMPPYEVKYCFQRAE